MPVSIRRWYSSTVKRRGGIMSPSSSGLWSAPSSSKVDVLKSQLVVHFHGHSMPAKQFPGLVAQRHRNNCVKRDQGEFQTIHEVACCQPRLIALPPDVVVEFEKLLPDGISEDSSFGLHGTA